MTTGTRSHSPVRATAGAGAAPHPHGPPGAAASATLSLRLLIAGTLPLLLFHALRQSLQAMSVVRPSLYAIAAANLVNGLANYALIFGRWGCPRLGAPGSACATAAARWAMFLWLLLAARRPLCERMEGLSGWRGLGGLWRRPGGRPPPAPPLPIGPPLRPHPTHAQPGVAEH